MQCKKADGKVGWCATLLLPKLLLLLLPAACAEAAHNLHREWQVIDAGTLNQREKEEGQGASLEYGIRGDAAGWCAAAEGAEHRS
jgi:hypothetical protein